MAKPIVTFDCDGVFANFTKAYTNLVNARFGTDYTEDWPAYNCCPSYFTKEHWDGGFDAIKEVPYFLLMLEHYPDVPFKKLGAMMFEGAFTGYVVSQRGTTTDPAAQTRIWLNERGLTDLQGVIVGYQPRAAMLQLLGSEAHIDDSGDHVEDLRRSGVNAYLLNRTWNQDAKVAPEYRVQSIDEFLEKAVQPLLPAETAKSFFSPPQISDLVSIPDCMTLPASARLIRDVGFQFSALPESQRHQVQ